MERHNTDHGSPKIHSIPHDHMISWDKNFPDFSKQINYSDDIPEFKQYGGNRSMMDYPKAFSDANFDGISDFKECMRCGGEVQFLWRGTMYSVSGNVGNNEDGTRKMLICQSGTAEVNESTAKWCSNADEVLEYMVGEDRLRDVITKVEVFERTI